MTARRPKTEPATTGHIKKHPEETFPNPPHWPKETINPPQMGFFEVSLWSRQASLESCSNLLSKAGKKVSSVN